MNFCRKVHVQCKRELCCHLFGVSLILQGALLIGNVCFRMMRCIFGNSRCKCMVSKQKLFVANEENEPAHEIFERIAFSKEQRQR